MAGRNLRLTLALALLHSAAQERARCLPPSLLLRQALTRPVPDTGIPAPQPWGGMGGTREARRVAKCLAQPRKRNSGRASPGCYHLTLPAWPGASH